MARFSYFLSICVLALITSFHETSCRPTLLSYGLDHRDTLLARDSDDISSPPLRLRVPIVYYGQQYNTVYINQNGVISFEAPISSFVNVQFPLDYPAIAPFYSDVDTRIQGSIYYRESQEAELIEVVRRILYDYFQSAITFKPTSLLIVTWDSVGYFDRKTDKTNTYQVVIGTNGQDSFALLLYDKLEWIQGTGKNPSLPDAKAQAGFISGAGPHFSLRGSGTDQVSNLHKRSNSDTAGLWAFRIGQVGESGVEEPDLKVGLDESSDSGSSCSTGFTECHSQAKCVDYSPGFCCKCVPGFYGNGKICLQDSVALRVTGKVKGILNGIALDDAELFSYILPGEGRAYTAIAKIPSRLGYDIQTVSVFGTIIGWLFSVQIKGAPNGFQLTGGVFNYTAEISFTQTGQKVTISQMYDGLDVFSHLKVDTRIYGNTAVIPVGKTIEVNDYEMQMTRVSPGLIRSTSSHNYRVDGTSVDNPFTIEQTIAYDECEAAPPNSPELDITRMKIGRNYIAYDSEQEIARFAFTSKITPNEGEDPCKENKDKCGPHSTCVANDDSYKCICNLGFEETYNEHGVSECTDIDECRVGSSTCDATAICLNVAGSFHCQCRSSYSGDGHTCNKILSCEDVNCGPNAECTEISIGVPECRCLQGFYGDGIYCVQATGREVDVTQSNCQSNPDLCDPFASCTFSRYSNSYVCSCNSGYSGDGIRCIREGSESCELGNEDTCDVNAYCKLDESHQTYACTCKRGYTGDGFTCQRDSQDSEIPEPICFANYCYCPSGYAYDDLRNECQTAAEIEEAPETGHPGNAGSSPSSSDSCERNPHLCDPNALCMQVAQNVFDCVCQTGFSGDGHLCTSETQCRSHEECGPYGMCALDPSGRSYSCKCREGFEGTNGLDCRPSRDAGCDVTRACDRNADCKWIPEQSKYLCECRPGYQGDGLTCAEDLLGCNVLNNCSPHGQCDFDPQSRGYRCRCIEGYDGNGIICKSRASCYTDRSICDPNAECLPNTQTREYSCVCRSGFQGDGQECRQVLPRDRTFLLVAKGMSIFKVPVNGDSPSLLYIERLQTAIGIDKDCGNEKVFWGDVAGRVIRQGNFNGTNKASFLDEDIGSPEGLALDSGSQTLYWTDSLKDTIEVAHIPTKKRRTLIDKGLVNPRGIAINSRRSRLFWSDWNRDHPKIEFSGLDGVGRQTLVGDGLSLPNSLVVDIHSDQLCWADAGNHNIECIGIDGRNRQVIIARILYPFGLVLDSDIFYWTDWNTTQIESTTRSAGRTGQSLPVVLGGPGKLYGLVIVPATCPQEYSPCQYNVCNENQICLPNIRGARSCLCVNNSTTGCVDAF